MNKLLISTTKANILESYVLVLRSIEDVPSESMNMILALLLLLPCDFLELPHNHIPFVQELIVESTSN